MTKLKSELQEIQNIMVQNIDDVLSRGDALQCKFSKRKIFKRNLLEFLKLFF